MARRTGVPAVAAVIGALVATPAFADVSVSPSSAVQTTGENLTFHVTNTGTAPIGTVVLKIPDDTPVAEIYPLSVDDWAPKIQLKDLATPLATIHGGTPAKQSASSITWIAMPGRQLAVGTSTDLSIAIGPLPTLSSMSFTLVTTYADGTPGPTMPAQIALTPAAEGQAATHGHAGTATGATGDDAEEAAFAAAVADATRGPSIWAIGGWVVAGLALVGAAIYFLRGRHRADEDDEPEDEDESVTAADITDKAEETKAEETKAEETKAEEIKAEEIKAETEQEPVGANKWSLRSSVGG